MDKTELHIFPTYQCNFTCKFCYQEEYKNTAILDICKLESTINKIKTDKNCDFSMVTLMGGELSTLPDDYIEKLMTIIESLGVPIQIFTNLYEIKPRLLKHSVFVSWDFDDRDHYDSVYKNMLLINRKFDISTVVSSKLLNKKIDDIVAFYSSISNLDRVYFSFFKPTIYNTEMSTTFDQYVDFIEKIKNSNANFKIYQTTKPILSDKRFLRIDPYLNVKQDIDFGIEEIISSDCNNCDSLKYCEYYQLVKSNNFKSCRYRAILINE